MEDDETIEMAIIPVLTKYREKHIKLVKGNLLKQPVDQFIFSGFVGGYTPNEGTVWNAARLHFFGPEGPTNYLDLWGQEQRVADTSVVRFQTQEKFKQNFPLLCLEMKGADIASENLNDDKSLNYSFRKSLYSLHHACRELALEGRLGRTIGMPLLGTGDQKLPIDVFSKLIKQFAEDALSTIHSLNEIVICAYTKQDAEQLLGAFKRLSNQDSGVPRENLSKYEQDSIEHLIGIIRQNLNEVFDDDEDLQKELLGLLQRYSSKTFDKESIALSARIFLQNALHASKNENNLMNKIEQLRLKTGTPNIWYSYFHLIRIIGNTAAHPENAARRITTQDLVGILIGLKEFTDAWPKIKLIL